MSLNRKSQHEAEVALLGYANALKQLAAESTRFELAKAQNNDKLPLHMWREWREWKKRLRAADQEFEKFYR